MTLIEPNSSAQLIAGDPNSLALRIRLLWEEDRFLHEVHLLSDDSEICISGALADKTDTSWPKHPPLQQASIEEINGQMTILGVGLAGTSHWSLSIETIHQPNPAIRFDYACKCGGDAEYLGSRYAVPAAIDSSTDAFAGILLKSGDHCVQIAPDDDGSLATLCTEENWWEVRPEASGKLARWKYQLQLM